ncbi:hypothetical protein HK096_004158 [Nowakowskiella sp. JEL0078]|nr:hypothetical protein HK096_004158 [Nowakowskiella sp. JEL0078]
MIFKSRHNIYIPPATDIFSLLFKSKIETLEDSTAFIDPITEKKISFNELQNSSLSFASSLPTLGFDKWDVVAVFSPNCIEYPTVVYGVLVAGGTISPLNPNYTIDEVLRDSKAKFIVTSIDGLPIIEEASKIVGIPSSRIFTIGSAITNRNFLPVTSFFTLRGNFDCPQLTEFEIKNNPAFLCYSSGTTGRPKGVITTHYNMVSNVIQYTYFEKFISNTECWVAVLPFFHIYGLNVLLISSVYMRIPVVIHRKFDLELFLSSIEKYKITKLHVAPPVMIALAKHPMINKFNLSSIDAITSGAAPLTVELGNEVATRLNVKVKQGYGMTETSPVTHMAIDDDIVPGSVGKLVPNSEALIVDPVTKQRMGIGKEGELWIRGPMVMKGYLNNEKATKETICQDGWIHTGDIAIVDENENFFIVDRLKELINLKYKGFQVAPAEMEGLILSHPAVADAAVIGIQDNAAGELPRAFVVLKPNSSIKEKDIQQFVEAKAAPHKRLRGGVEFVDSIPKSASGKILRRIIRDEFSKRNLKSKL